MPVWLDNLVSYLSEWTDLPGQEEPEVKENSAGASSSKQQKSQQQEDAHVQYLRNIGKTVASILDPLGEEELKISSHFTLCCYFLLMCDVKFSLIRISTVFYKNFIVACIVISPLNLFRLYIWIVY
jgi:hypothetical protein